MPCLNGRMRLLSVRGLSLPYWAAIAGRGKQNASLIRARAFTALKLPYKVNFSSRRNTNKVRFAVRILKIEIPLNKHGS